MQKALREAERLAEINSKRTTGDGEEGERETKRRKKKMKMLAAASLAGNVKLTPPKPSATTLRRPQRWNDRKIEK